MKVIVFGASGGVGTAAVQQAVAAGHEVTAYVRDPAKLSAPDGVTVVQDDALDEAAVRGALASQDAVLCCLGSRAGLKPSDELERMASVLADGMRAQGVRRLVVCSSAGVEDELTGPAGKVIAFTLRNPLRDHRAALDRYRAIDPELTIARPLGLTDDPLREDYRRAAPGVPRGGRSIPRASVAHFMVSALGDPDTVGASVGLAI